MTPAIGPGEALDVHHLEHVLEGQRLEVEPAARVVVGRDGLGVAVDHHRVVAGVAQGEAGVHAGVVELDALADPVRTGAEDDHRRALARGDLVLLVVGAVVVRRQRRELGRAGVDRLVDRAHAEGVAHPADDRLRHPAQGGDLGVAEAVPLGQPQQVGGQLLGGRDDGIRDLLDEGHLVEEPRVDAGGLVHLLDRQPAAQRLLHEHDAAVGGAPRPRRARSRACSVVGRGPSQWKLLPFFSSERSAFCSASVNERPIDIASPTDFIVVVRVSSAAGNFSNANRGTLTTT